MNRAKRPEDSNPKNNKSSKNSSPNFLQEKTSASANQSNSKKTTTRTTTSPSSTPLQASKPGTTASKKSTSSKPNSPPERSSPPSPPPPGIGSIEPDTRGKTTIREILAAHRKIETCSKCHRRSSAVRAFVRREFGHEFRRRDGELKARRTDCVRHPSGHASGCNARRGNPDRGIPGAQPRV